MYGKAILFGVTFLAAYVWAMVGVLGPGSALWLPDAVLLTALLLTPVRQGWMYLLIALPIRLLVRSDPSPPDWFLWASFANDSLKALLSSYLLRRLLKPSVRLEKIRDYVIFLLVTGLLSPALSATAGAASRALLGDPFWTVWPRWFLGDAIAVILFVPAALFAAERKFRRPASTLIELTLLSIGVLVASWLAFSGEHGSTPFGLLLVYLPVPFVVWSIVRAGPAGASFTVTTVALIAVAGANNGRGPFSAYPDAVNLLAVQLFVLLLAIPVTALAIALDERRSAERALKQSEDELQVQNRQLHYLAGRLIDAQEDERRRISRDLHDDIGQRLALVGLSLNEVERRQAPTEIAVRSRLRDIQDDVSELCRDIHDLSRALHSSKLQHLGLAPALRGWCRHLSEQHGVAIDVIGDGEPALDVDSSTCLFRVVQEALSNAIKHGRAKQITVDLVRRPDAVAVRILDNGSGFDPRTPTSGLGIVSMRERLRFLGGTLAVKAMPGHGTDLYAEIPCSAPAAPLADIDQAIS